MRRAPFGARLLSGRLSSGRHYADWKCAFNVKCRRCRYGTTIYLPILIDKFGQIAWLRISRQSFVAANVGVAPADVEPIATATATPTATSWRTIATGSSRAGSAAPCCPCASACRPQIVMVDVGFEAIQRLRPKSLVPPCEP